ncbi:fibrinogen-like protein 1 [Saccostrea echinata]|uniref:fibrinogen-like protein 1 n=1 Tax=Saccostrea echinata TaxID=191078 RepID=UPI002A83F2F1|nr:fibrinogen-like protein 1 [Saccostrea echinata]
MAFIWCLSGQDIEKKIQYGKRMLDALIDIVQGVSFIECTEECFIATRPNVTAKQAEKAVPGTALGLLWGCCGTALESRPSSPRDCFLGLFCSLMCEKGYLVTCATDVTSIETLDIDNKEIDVPFVYSEGHKWTVIQRRCFNNTDFYRRWSDYKAGFGNFKEKSDFWIGNDVIHMLTKNGYNYMRVEMLKTDNEPLEAEYSHFLVGDESTEYNLTVSGFTGLYDCMTNKIDKRADANGLKFSTIDVENDPWKNGICAYHCKSGWWFHSCTCGNVNGLFGNEKTSFVMRWMCADGWICPLQATRILIRP